MVYDIFYTKRAIKAFLRMPRETSNAIRQKLEQIAADPFASHPNAKKLQCRDGYRLRQGNWRVIYEIQQNKIVIFVLEIGLRKEVYR
jgi:mRNA interferase RelE/StbE